MGRLWTRLRKFYSDLLFQITDFFFKNTRKKIVWAIQNNDEELLSALISKGADFTSPVLGKDNPLQVAVNSGTLESVFSLVQAHFGGVPELAELQEQVRG